MAIAIENTLKEAGFTDQQVHVLIPVFEKAKEPPIEHLITKLEIRLLKWLVTLVIALAGLIYFAIYSPLNTQITSVETSLNQRITSVETSLNQRITSAETSLNQRITSVEASLNQRIDDLKEDVAENRAMIQKVLEKLDELEDKIDRSSQ